MQKHSPAASTRDSPSTRLLLVDSYVRSVQRAWFQGTEPQCRYIFQAPAAGPDQHRLVRQVLFDELPGSDLDCVQVLDGARTVFMLDTIHYAGCRQLSAGEVMQAMAAYSVNAQTSIPLHGEQIRLGRITVSLDIRSLGSSPLGTQVMAVMD